MIFKRVKNRKRRKDDLGYKECSSNPENSCRTCRYAQSSREYGTGRPILECFVLLDGLFLMSQETFETKPEAGCDAWAGKDSWKTIKKEINTRKRQGERTNG